MAFDTVNILMFIVIFVIILVLMYQTWRGFRLYRKRLISKVKTPKLRSRAVIYDKRFGGARVEGYEPMGNGFEKAIVWLRSFDNHVFSQIYHSSELKPQNNIQAMAGAHTPVWTATGLNHPSGLVDIERLELEAENARMKDEKIVQKAKVKITINESATIPDKMEEILKEWQKPRQQELKVLK